MYGMEDADLRMTFDFRVRSREDKLDLALGDAGRLLFADGEVILEIKVKDVYPMWLIRGLEKLSIYPCSFSKYGNVYKKYLLSGYLEELAATAQ